MTTITKEWLQNMITGIESIIDDKSFVCSEIAFEIGVVNNILTAFKIALASLAAEPVSQAYNLPQTHFEQVADLYEMQFEDGRTCAFHTEAKKAAQWIQSCDGNRVQQYVKQERLQNALSGNSPVTPDGWISCSERMPDDGQHVIILCDGAFVLYAQYRDGEFFDVVRNGEEFFETQSRNATHWMPLPEPPQEVS